MPPDAPLTPPPAAAVARFDDDFARLARGRRRRGLVLGVSGGPDSIALLLLAKAALDLPLLVVTVIHNLDPGRAGDAAAVARVCAALGVEAVTATITPADWRRAGPGNRHAIARRLRYRHLTEIAERADLDIATAHHADDQLETMLMRLNRGSGVAGLAGVRGVNRKILRPLLHWRRGELAAVVAACGAVAVDDPANRDRRYDRARLRAALATADWLDPLAFARSGAALAQADEALDWMAATLSGEWSEGPPGCLRIAAPAADLPHELVRRFLLRAIGRLRPGATIRGATLDRLIAALAAGQTRTVAGLLIRPDRGTGTWSFAPAPPRRDRTTIPHA